MTRIVSASLGLVLGAFVLIGCTDAGKCVRGEPGCACKTDGTCDTDATCNNEKMCIARTGGGGGTSGGGGGSGGQPPVDIECVDDDFQSACNAFCDVYCAVQARMCAESRCGGSDCDEDACRTGCGGEDPECLQAGCQMLKDSECKDYGAPNDAGVFESFCEDDDPVCTPDPEFGCSDVCGDNEYQTGGDFAGNDLCQDGQTGSTGTKRCARGTDCTDCGPRTCAGRNEACGVNGDCCGFPNDAFCIMGLQQCFAVCSDERPCVTGETCTPLSGGADSVCVPD